MSLYDDASLVFIPAGAAGRGKDQFGRIYTLKPEEELKEELVTNGGFDTDSDWTKGTGITIADGKAVFTDVTPYARLKTNDTVFTSGTKYKLSYEITEWDSSSDGRITVQQEDQLTIGGFVTGPGKYSDIFEARTYVDENDNNILLTKLVFKVTAGTVSCKIDNVSVREVEKSSADFEITRGTDLGATFINKDGLIDKSYENLLLGTEDLNNSTYWSVPASPRYTNPLPEGEVVGYNGRKDGVFTLDKTSGHNYYLMSSKPGNTVTTADDEVWTYSVYVKSADGVSELLIGIWDSNDDNDPNWNQTSHGNNTFTLKGDTVAGDANSNDTNPKTAPRYYMEKIGDDGWYRCSITNVSQIEDRQVRFQPREPYSIDGVTHQSPGKVYIMHPQFEKGSKPSPYVKTESETVVGGLKVDEPRFDYEGGGCPGLLIERAKTNLFEQSEWFKSWSNTGVADSSFILTPNYAISPDGGYNATYYNASSHAVASNTEGWRRHFYRVTLEASTKYVFSFYCKNINATRLRTRVYDNENGVDVVTAKDYLADVNTTEWTRVELPFTTKADVTDYSVYLQTGMTITDNSDGTWNGQPGGGVLWWGAQLEKQDHSGSLDGYASSYIPTNGTTVTRDLDNITHLSNTYVDGITNNYNTTIFFDGKNLRKVGNTRFVTIQDEGANEDPRILLYSTNYSDTETYKLRLQYRKNGISSKDVLISGPTDLEFGDRFKAIARFNGSAMDLFVNGTKYSTAAIEPQRDLNRIDLSENSDGGHKIESLIVWPKTLTDQECKDLTTL